MKRSWLAMGLVVLVLGAACSKKQTTANPEPPQAAPAAPQEESKSESAVAFVTASGQEIPFVTADADARKTKTEGVLNALFDDAQKDARSATPLESLEVLETYLQKEELDVDVLQEIHSRARAYRLMVKDPELLSMMSNKESDLHVQGDTVIEKSRSIMQQIGEKLELPESSWNYEDKENSEFSGQIRKALEEIGRGIEKSMREWLSQLPGKLLAD